MTTTNPLRNILGERPLPPLLTHAQEIALANRVSAGQAAEARRRLVSPSSRLTSRNRSSNNGWRPVIFTSLMAPRLCCSRWSCC